MALFKIAYTRVNTVKIGVKQTLFWYISSNIVSIINAMTMLCCAKTRPELSYVDSTENISVPLGPTEAGGRLNKKDGLTRYGNSHVKDKKS